MNSAYVFKVDLAGMFVLCVLHVVVVLAVVVASVVVPGGGNTAVGTAIVITRSVAAKMPPPIIFDFFDIPIKVINNQCLFNIINLNYGTRVEPHRILRL